MKVNKNNDQLSGMVMIQGTSSHAGKSLIATALCRIMAEEAATAPFKGWNMSHRSWKTSKGKEVGIGQAIQALAAGIEPQAVMNPLLLKPEPGSRNKPKLLVQGEPLDETFSYKGQEYTQWGLEVISQSLKELQSRYEIIILEGAGSPAEINVKDRDLANMKVALLQKTPVIMVADIERGGAFASLVGTMELLPPAERDLVAGFIINKFRGQKEILKPGLNHLEARTGKPVLGVLPYVDNLSLPEEDIVMGDKQGKTKNDSDIISPDISEYRDDLDRLAQVFRDNIDIKKIKEIIKEGEWKVK